MDDGYVPTIDRVAGEPRVRMRVSQEERGRSHARIVGSASRRPRARGLDGASMAGVTRDAGLTHSGSYGPSDAEDASAEAARDAALAADLAEGGEALARFRALRPSPEHRWWARW